MNAKAWSKYTPKALLKYLIKLLKFVVIWRRLFLPVGKKEFSEKKKKNSDITKNETRLAMLPGYSRA